MKIIITFITLFFTLLAGSGWAQSWKQESGPGGNGVSAIAISHKNYLFVASKCIQRSTDSGQSWERVGLDIPANAEFLDLRVKSSGSLFSLLRFPHPSNLTGIWKSNDDGITWELVKHVAFYDDSYLRMNLIPNGDIYVYNCLDANYIVSHNDGNSWIDTSADVEGRLRNIWGDNHGHIFIATHEFLYRSIDNGLSWQKIINGLPGYNTNYFGDLFTGMAEDLNGNLYITSVGEIASNNYGLFKSIDGGRTWDSIFKWNGLIDLKITPKGDIYIGGGAGLYSVSYDFAKTWNVVKFPINSFGVPTIPVLDSITGVFYFNFNSTIYSSALDVIMGWNRIDVPLGKISSIVCHPNGSLIAFTSDEGVLGRSYPQSRIWLTKDGGHHWEENQFYIDSHANSSSEFYASALDSSYNIISSSLGYITRSINGGISWTNRPTQLTNGLITGIAIGFNGDIFVSSSSEGMFRSTDNGVTWDQLNNGIVNKPLFSIAINKSGDVYVGGINIIYKSTNEGVSWIKLTTNFPINSGKVTSMVINNKGDIIAGIDSSGVFSSADNGATWALKAIGLNATKVNTLLTTPVGKVFAGTDSGIFFLDTNVIGNWVQMNQGLSTMNVLSLSRDKKGRLYAGTDICGVFSSILTYNIADSNSSVSINIKSDATFLGANFPNPFISSTSIPFMIGKRTNLILEVFDILGMNRIILASGIYDAGSYEAKFNRDNLEAGTYFVRLLTENQSFTKPIIIIK